MKKINNFINERLKLNKDSKIQKYLNFKGYDESILNVNIKDINELKEVLTNFFNKPNIQVQKDFNTDYYIQDNWSWMDITKSFKIEDIREKTGWIINVAETTNKNIVIQYYRYWRNSKGHGSWHQSKIIGADGNAYEYGTNFLKWLYQTKKETVENIANVNVFGGFGLEKE